jgi:peptidoglycan/xylan/chitin deacetylase (PgdA/CDA1 family)
MAAPAIVNLTVHGIGAPARRLDPGEELTWVSIGQFEHVLDAIMGLPDVQITFDDGNLSDVEIALPRLRQRGLVGKFFILAGRLGEPGRLDHAHVRELVDAGMVVGSHGWAHVDWRRISDEEAHVEIDNSLSLVTELIGRPVRYVAVPFGSYDRKVLARLRRASVERVYTSDCRRARPHSWLQSRYSLQHDLDQEWLHTVLHCRPQLAAQVRGFAVGQIKRLRG